MAHKNKTNISPYTTRQQSRAQATQATTSASGKPKQTLKGRHKKPNEIYPQAEAQDRIADIFRNHNFSTYEFPVIEKLAHFYRLLMLNQEKENFTRLLNLRDITIRHYIDCLIVAKLTDLSFPLLDMGTGPGFPGLPLKFIFPEEKIILAEGVQRRVEFLKQVRSTMNLKNLDIIGRNINPFFAYPVQGVITRAVEDIRNTLSNVQSCLQTGGRVFLMKGPGVDPEIPLAEKEMGEFFKLEKDIAYTLPETEHQRRLLIYRKIKMSPLLDFDEEPWPED